MKLNLVKFQVPQKWTFHNYGKACLSVSFNGSDLNNKQPLTINNKTYMVGVIKIEPSPWGTGRFYVDNYLGEDFTESAEKQLTAKLAPLLPPYELPPYEEWVTENLERHREYLLNRMESELRGYEQTLKENYNDFSRSFHV